MTILTTTLKCRGEEIAVTTVQRPGESDEDFVKRHRESVEVVRKECEESE